MPFHHGFLLLLLVVLTAQCASPPAPSPAAPPDLSLNLPYAERGWTDREAAEFLADRFTFGPTPGLVAEIERSTPDGWLRDQLYPQRETALEDRLEDRYPALGMDTDKMARKYPAPALRLIYTLVRASIKGIDFTELTDDAAVLNEKLDLLTEDALLVRREDRELFSTVPELQEILDNQDYGDFNDLLFQLMAQKMDRATESRYQLREVLTDFWFNHFNVSITRINDSAPFVLAYERDVIRPNVLGKFRDMLTASAHHPAMINYLDQGKNNAAEGAPTLVPTRDPEEVYGEYYNTLKDVVDRHGINENYARELLELHTLGVDGGYRQRDVEELARILTGWKTPVTLQPLPGLIRTFVGLGLRGQDQAEVTKTFYFNPEWHDAGAKTFLGERFPGGRGYEEGVRALDMVSSHPSTARHLARKLVARFTRDDPPPAVVDAVAAAFRSSGGDLREMMLTMVRQPGFWDKSFRRAKVKPPLHFVAASIRSGSVTVRDKAEILRWCTRMGQPLYACQPPTGYTYDRAFWTTGYGLLRRMDFAQTFTSTEEAAFALARPEFQTY